MGRRGRLRVLTICATTVLVTAAAVTPTFAAPPPDPDSLTATALTPDSDVIETAKAPSAKLAESDPALLASTDSTPTTIMVKLDYDAAAAYEGGVDGFAATSPEVTGTTLRTSDPAVSTYLKHLDGRAAAAAKAIRAAVPSARVTGTFNVAYGGLAVTLPESSAKDLLAIPAVAAVQVDSVEHVQTDVTSSPVAAGAPSVLTAAAPQNGTSGFIGAEKVWPSLGGRDHAGQGQIVGVIDTGIWPEHPMLADVGLPKPAGGPWACQFGDGGADLGAAFTCNNKLIGAYTFLATNLSVGGVGAGEYCVSAARCSARDAEGHGTHTATTAAGSYVASAPMLGTDRGPVSGIAPGASVIAYKVCSAGAGCYSSDSVAAIQQAIIDGVDVINFSISGGESAYTDPVELAFLDATAAGISVNASAGNDGPGAGTANHAGPWVTTVGASTSDRAFSSTLTLTSSDGATYSKAGSTITTGVTGVPVVLAASVPGYTGGALCLTPFAAGSLTGQVVVCQRGTNGRVEKGFNAFQGGAAGMILFNPTASDTETDNHFLPAIHLEGPNTDLLAFLAGHPGITATWATGQVVASQGDVMAGFSSRGPLGDFLKPDITAPGVQVLAGNTPTPVDIASGPPGQLFQAIAGTSMSSPHAAGVSLLVRAAHPGWTPAQVKSALMTSSLQSVVNVDGSPAGVFDRGAGSIRADRAVAPSLTFGYSTKAITGVVTDALHRVDLNLPSIAVNPLPGAVTTTRVAKNVSGATQTYRVTATGADGLKIVVSPSTFTLRQNDKQKLTVLVDGTATTAGWHSGQITVKPTRGNAAVLPVVVNTGDAAITLAQTCDPTAIRIGAQTSCTVTATNTLPVEAQAKIVVPSLSGLPIRSVTAPARKTTLGAVWNGTLSPALAPTITSIVPGETPGGGYLPLSLFGIAPVAGAGDETITNFTVPAFKYGSETYTRIGVDSNGYVIVGGGSSEDNSCCNVQTFPDPARPNNVLAPYWTDLDLTPAAGRTAALRVGTLSDGVSTWLVVDYNSVPEYGTNAPNSFQIWIQTGDTEGVSYAYGALSPITSPLGAGAENRDGTSGANITPVADGQFVVTTAPPTPGGSVTFGYTATGVSKGTWTLAAQLTSPLLRTTSIAPVAIKVTR
ncbi:S8 family serine peptidase [Cellulomonas sp. ICMP 17802]|uniref:S8 family serine peptidase n=1 Tax=Cellulomonas sp. ICMP 17802 TaxID=3239199 RepID=UPI00351BCED3